MKFPFLLAIVAFASISLQAPAVAQSPWIFEPPGMAARGKLVVLLQGEKRQIDGDFVALVEGDKLHVALNTRGMLNASPEDELLVSLVQPSGEAQSIRPDPNGMLVFENVSQGLAALVVTADSLANTSLASLYAAVPLFIASVEEDAPDPEPEPFQLPVAKVNPQRLTEALNEDPEEPSPDSELLSSDDFEIVPFSQFRVLRLADGSIQGQVVVPQRGFLTVPGKTRIELIREGQTVATAITESDGSFLAQNVPLGVNSLVATGRSGHAAYSIEVVERKQLGLDPANTISGDPPARVHLVGMQGQVGQSLMVCLIPPALMDEVREVLKDRLPGSGSELAMDPNSAAPAFAGGAQNGALSGGGMGGGGAGAGAFGGLGDWLGLAGLGVGIAALSDSDDDGFNQNVTTRIVVGP